MDNTSSSLTLRDMISFSVFTEYLGLSPKQVRYFMYAKKDQLYSNFIINKKNGKIRNISAPKPQLKSVQKKIKVLLDDSFYPRICVQGFVTGRSIRENAEMHCHKKFLLNLDLKNFFPTITSKRIFGLLVTYGASKEVALCITKIVTLQEVLPQGAPTSPVISNMICGPLDGQLIQFSKKYGVFYTRYADDLTFSSRKPFPACFIDAKEKNVGNGLSTIIKKNGFEINIDKTKLATRCQHQEVTGIVVNQFPNIKRCYIRNLRTLLHLYKTKGKMVASSYYYTHIKPRQNKLGEPFDIDHVIQGQLAFISFTRGVEKNRYHIYNKYANEFNQLCPESKIKLIEPHPIWRSNTVVIEVVF